MGKACYEPSWHPYSDARPPEWKVVRVIDASVVRDRVQTDGGYLVAAEQFKRLYADRMEAVRRWQDMARQWLQWEKECQDG